MADEIDIANEQMQRNTEATIKSMQASAGVTPENHTGECIWCLTPVKDLRRWCDVECRDDWTEAKDK